MKCEYCDNEVPRGKVVCPSCGAAVQHSIEQSVERNIPPPVSVIPENVQHVDRSSLGNSYLPVEKKSRVVYVLLAFFLGELGIHNFYAGYIGRGVVQLLITILTLGILFWVSWTWAIVELCITTHDRKGVPFS